MPSLRERKKLTEMTQVVSGWNPKTGKKPTKEELKAARSWIADYESRR
tara:strand:+ start:664 stop:807 length:144 start_codon:yes stop_codon:yes gene_type:complete